MLRLPLCPYCKARFFYREVAKNRKEGRMECPHCHKTFLIKSRRPRAVLYGAAAVLAVACNVLLMYWIPFLTMPVLLCATLLILLAAWLLTPCAVRYQALDRRERKKYKRERTPAGK